MGVIRLANGWERFTDLMFRLTHRKKLNEEAQLFAQARVMAALRLEQAIWDMRTHRARREGAKR